MTLKTTGFEGIQGPKVSLLFKRRYTRELLAKAFALEWLDLGAARELAGAIVDLSALTPRSVRSAATISKVSNSSSVNKPFASDA